jgi:hypothetical protein
MPTTQRRRRPNRRTRRTPMTPGRRRRTHRFIRALAGNTPALMPSATGNTFRRRLNANAPVFMPAGLRPSGTANSFARRMNPNAEEYIPGNNAEENREAMMENLRLSGSKLPIWTQNY